MSQGLRAYETAARQSPGKDGALVRGDAISSQGRWQARHKDLIDNVLAAADPSTSWELRCWPSSRLSARDAITLAVRKIRPPAQPALPPSLFPPPPRAVVAPASAFSIAAPGGVREGDSLLVPVTFSARVSFVAGFGVDSVFGR